MTKIVDQDLKDLAESECIKSFGDEEWNTMFSGDQAAYIDTWIDGYLYAKSKKGKDHD